MPCFNEEANVERAYQEIKQVFVALHGRYTYEHIFIDNASTDGTVAILKEIAKKDKNVKIIVNARNFGHIRSPYYGLLQGTGDAVILIASDLQDPPEIIPEFIEKWESGNQVVVGVKTQSGESSLMFAVRKVFYSLIKRMAETEQIKNFTGYGLYDRVIITTLRKLNEPYPYFRGLITDLGFQRAEVAFFQPTRQRGITKNNFYTLYDMAMMGFVNYSKLPLRLAAFMGFLSSLFSLMVASFYFFYKLLFWNQFQVGVAPAVIGLFLFSSVQLFFIGILGEYIGAIYTQVKAHPLVIEKERINFN